MKVGELFLIPTPDPSITFADRYRMVLEMAEYGNDKGFEAVWVTEHHFSDYGYSPNPLMLLGEVGHVAPNLRLGTAILVLPLWHPVRMAEDVATLDVLSGGRVDVGIGRGYQPYEFGALGVDLAKNRDQFNEALNIALGVWTKDDFEYDGRFWQIPPTTVFPKPLQQPHPPIWMAATTPPSIRSAVERGYHLCTGTGAVFEELQQRNAYIDSVLADLGRPPEGIERAANRFVFCSTSKAEIQDAIEQSRWQIRVSRALTGGGVPPGGRNVAPAYPGEPDEEVWQRRMIIGDPEECVRRIQNLADSGITYIFGLFEFGGLDHDVAMRSLAMFSEHVMPVIRDIEPVRVDAEQREVIKDAFLRAGPGYQGV